VPSCLPCRFVCYNLGSYGLALKGQNAEDALVSSAKRLPADKPFEGFDSQGEFLMASDLLGASARRGGGEVSRAVYSGP